MEDVLSITEVVLLTGIVVIESQNGLGWRGP